MHIRTTGSGPHVVLLHGVPGSGASWDAVAELLARDHRVHVPDLLGFGASPRPDAKEALMPAAQAEAVAEAVDAPDFLLVGHDFGGPVAIELAAAHPQRVSALVLASTNAFADTPIPFPLSTLLLPLVGGLAERALFSRPSLKMMLRQGTGDSPSGPDPQAAIGDAGQLASIQTIFATVLRELRERYEPVEAALRGLEMPVHVVWGDRDPFFPLAQARRTAAAAPGSPEAIILRGAGHFLPEERPQELAAQIRRAAAQPSASRAQPPRQAATR